MANDIQIKVFDLIAEALGVDASEISIESHFINDLGADSLDLVELVMAFENQFDIKIPDEDAEKIVSVSDAVDYITSAKS